MSVTDLDPAAPTAPVVRRGPGPRLRIVGLVLTAGALIALGYAAGLHSAWAAHHPTLVTGTVERIPSVPPWGTFTPDGGGDPVDFALDEVIWRDGRTSDSGTVPSCLRSQDASFRAQVTVIELARPFGSGSYRQVVSLTCPGGS